ncbi:MAG: TlpA disulfide reductase family protein [Chthoniobacterales bacterium]
MKKISAFFGAISIVVILSTSAMGQSNPPVATSDLSQYKTADDLFNYLKQMFVSSMQTDKALSRDEQMKTVGENIKKFDAAAPEFAKRYPQDPRRWEIKMMLVSGEGIKPMIGLEAPSPESMKKQLSEIADAKDASEKVRSMAAAQIVVFAIANSSDEMEVEQSISRFESKYPQSPIDVELRKMQLKKLQAKDPAKADTLMKRLAGNSNPMVAKMASEKLAQADQLKKPLELKFTAVDGSEVDLSKLRGKVVLLDFWATWCGPCKAEVPHVVEAYKKLHDKGFEIIGISLDQNKEALDAYIKENGMTWPQYFDGKGWKNEISTRFNINSIPAMWLIDKKGMVATTEARGNLAEQVEKLLAK